MLIEIQNLITELLELPPPLNAVALDAIFSKNSYSNLRTISILDELVEHIRQLDTLNGLIKVSLVEAAKLYVLKTQQARLNKLMTDNAQLKQKIETLDEDIKKDDHELETLFKKFSAKILAHLLKPTPVDSKLPPLEAKKDQIKQYFDQLKKILHEKEKLAAKVMLLKLKNQINLLRLELSTINVICTDDNAKDNYQSKIASVTLQNKSAAGIKTKLIELQDAIAKHISAATISTKITDIERQCNEIAAEIEKYETACDTLYILDEATKKNLKSQFKNSPDKAALIKQYTKQDNSLFNFNPFALLGWATPSNPPANTDNEMFDKSREYLQWLLDRHNLESKLKQLNLHKTALESLKPSDSTDLEKLTKLMADARTFCKTNPSLIQAINSSSSALDCYLALGDNIVLIQQKPLALNKLHDLQAVNKELVALRAKHQLLASNDSEIPVETELKKQEAELLNQIETADILQQQLQLCTQFISQFTAMDKAITKRNEEKGRYLEVEKTIKSTDSTLLQIQIAKLTESLSSHQVNIEETMIHIKALTPPTQIVSTDSNQPKKETPSQSSIERLQTIAALMAGAKAATSAPAKTIAPLQHSPSTQPLAVADNTLRIETVRQDSQMQRSGDASLVSMAIPGAASIPSEGLQTPTPLQPPATLANERTKDSAPTPMESNKNAASKSNEAVKAPSPLQPSATDSIDVIRSSVPNLTESMKAEVPVQSPQKPFATHSQEIINDSAPLSTALIPGTIDKPDEGVHVVATTRQLPATPALVQTKRAIITKSPGEPGSNPTQSTVTHLEDTTTISPRGRALSRIDEETESELIDETPVQKLYNWNHKIIDLLRSEAQDIQQWYNALYDSITTFTVHAPSSLNRPSHLLKDILFELEQRKNSDIIRAYMRLCPTPNQNLNQLLALKPDQSIVDLPFDEVDELKNAPLELQPLYHHYIKLKKMHPVEAELLLQAIRILCKTNSLVDSPSLSLDPRYETLKRHRGFLKVWEVLEDFFRMIIGKITGQAEYEYYKRPCFFNTASAQLIEEVELNTQDDFAP